jgi:hypothetical protein
MEHKNTENRGEEPVYRAKVTASTRDCYQIVERGWYDLMYGSSLLGQTEWENNMQWDYEYLCVKRFHIGTNV